MVFSNIIKLIYIIIKNLKIVFRSWSSLFLLIIGPLLLILIVGFVFGGSEIHDVNIGIISKNGENSQDIITSLQSKDVRTKEYYSLQKCIYDLKLDKVQVCAEFSDEFGEKREENKKQKTKAITFYYDNTKYNLAPYITEYIKEKLEVTSEQITMEIATNILSNVEEAVIFMNAASEDLNVFAENARNIRDDLIETKTTLEEIKAKVDPLYEEALVLKENLENHSNEVNSTVNLLHSNKDIIINQTDAIIGMIDALKSEIISYNNQINKTIAELGLNYTENISSSLLNNLTALQSRLLNLKQLLIDYDNIILDTNKKVYEKTSQLVELLDEIKTFIDVSIEKTQKNIILMSNAIVEMEKVKKELDENIEKFSGVDKMQAEALIKPIKSKFRPLLENLAKINLVFPIILVFIIMFISILLSNIVVLNEINSPSYFRNFLVPVKNYLFVAGLYVTNMIVILFQIMIFLVITKIKFKIDIFSNFAPLLVVIIMVTTIFTLIGMSIAYFMKKHQTSILLSTFITLSMFFFSDVIFPAEAMPKLAAAFAKLNPMVIAETIFRKIIYYNIPLHIQIGDLILLVVYIFLFIIIVKAASNYNKKIS